MSASQLDIFLDQNDLFICRPCGSRDSNERISVEIFHRVESPLSADELENLRSVVGKNEEILNFYSKYGSIEFYCDPRSDASAFYVAHPSQWSALKENFIPWLDLAEDAPELIPDWLESALIIGEIPNSGDYILLAMSGDVAGGVFQFGHDGFRFDLLGQTFDRFIGAITMPTPQLLTRIGSHTRYSDGVTKTQWIPIEYKTDSSL